MSATTESLKPLSPEMQDRYRQQALYLIDGGYLSDVERVAAALIQAHQIGYEIGRYSVEVAR